MPVPVGLAVVGLRRGNIHLRCVFPLSVSRSVVLSCLYKKALLTSLLLPPNNPGESDVRPTRSGSLHLVIPCHHTVDFRLLLLPSHGTKNKTVKKEKKTENVHMYYFVHP